jgi:hypothetical protein
VISDRARLRTVWPVLVLLASIVLAFAVHRISVDAPNVASGTVPEDPYDRRYALHPVLAYLHILPGVVYLIGAPFQLNRSFRTRHFALHRRMGRILLPAGLVAGVFAVAFGALHPFGGWLEGSAAALFGTYFVLALCTAFLAIRRRDATRHRRWMIRAFAVGLAVGTIRVWIGVFQAFGLLSERDSFGVAFWISFTLHALVAEAYLAWRPAYGGERRPARSALVRT